MTVKRIAQVICLVLLALAVGTCRGRSTPTPTATPAPATGTPTPAVNSAAFNPDGKFVVTASRDGTAQIYACEVCGPIEDLLALAHTRIARELTPEERVKYLHEPQNK